MHYEYGVEAWKTIEEGEKNCFLMANGLGGFCSMNLIGGVSRGDQAFFMAAKKAPNVRWHMITNFLETLNIDGKEYTLTSQRMSNSPDICGFQYLKKVVWEQYPIWTWEINEVVVTRKLLMQHGKNTVVVQYQIENPEGKDISLHICPLLRMTPKNTSFDKTLMQEFSLVGETGQSYYIKHGEDVLFFASNAELRPLRPKLFGTMYFSQDERDGRTEKGDVLINHELVCHVGKGQSVLECLCSTEAVAWKKDCFKHYEQEYLDRVEQLLQAAPVKGELGKQLVLSADAYVSYRESTGEKTILAGFPFFEDWGRDTMIALPGITMVTGRFAECKSILRTFAKYEKNGLLPNLFPEGDCNPMYNSADAPLLFINTVYEYMKFSKEEAFAIELFPVLERIVAAYREGTEFHIKMDVDGLILAGAELEQVTWMDVRVGDHLPTPRHGKPVEINAYWYSALKVMEELASKQGKTAQAEEYEKLAGKVKESFLEKFWNEEEQCLKDVLSGTYEENQVRCNQIWALTQPFTMLDAKKEQQVLEKVRKELYTTIGLRTLQSSDAAFHEIYIGPMQERDRAYHQGTVWAFPLGAYYRACMYWLDRMDKEESLTGVTSESERAEWEQHIADGMQALEAWLEEGCLGQIAEIYDGGTPTISRGCYAQAWSVGELLWAVYEYEQRTSERKERKRQHELCR